MSSICGVFNRNGKPAQPELIVTMTSVLDHFDADKTGTWRNLDVTVSLGHVMLFNTPESLNETLPYHHQPSRLTVTADARIDNRDDLYSLLDIPHHERPAVPDSQLILKSYQKWGRDCPKHLIGDFTFAIWDEGKNHLFCARDQMGAKPLFYHSTPSLFLFATEMKGLFHVIGKPKELNQLWIIDSLTALVADKEYTPYPEIFRLQPGHTLTVSAEKIEQEPYWNLDPGKEIHLRSEEEYVEAFREKLVEAVRCRTRSAYPLGSELSGGLDSSTVAALAADQAKKNNFPFITFSNVLGEVDDTLCGMIKDEKDIADKLRHHAGIQHYRNITNGNRGAIEALKQALIIQDGPTMQNYQTYSDLLIESVQREGIRTLLSGFGGDEGVSFQAGSYLSELVEEKGWQTLWLEFRHMRKNGEKFPVKGLALKTFVNAFPLLQKIARRFKTDRESQQKNSSSYHINTFSLNSEFYRQAGIPKRIETIPRIEREGNLRHQQFKRLMAPHTSLRMEYSSIFSTARRIEYRYPLLDIRLLEFHIALPASLKYKNGWGRYLFRKSIEGIVPPEIQWRIDKSGATIPGVLQRFTRDIREIKNLIDQTRLGKAATYLDLDLLIERCDRFASMQTNPYPIRRGAFMNALLLLLHFQQNP